MRVYFIDSELGHKEKIFEAKAGNAELLRHLYIEHYNSTAHRSVAEKARDSNGDLLVIVRDKVSNPAGQ